MSELVRVLSEDVEGMRVVRVLGEIDLSNTDEVREAISAAAANDVSSVVVDLSGTTYLDSSGIAMLFRLAEGLRYRRQTLRLVVPPDAPIRRVLEITRVPQVIPVQDAVTEASPQV